jgi:hypothetical protein
MLVYDWSCCQAIPVAGPGFCLEVIDVKRTTFWCVAVVALAIMAGCAGKDIRKDKVMASSPVMTSETPEGLVAETTDLDNDADADVWTWFSVTKKKGAEDVRVLVKKSTDINGDGRVDFTEYFSPDGKLTKEENDLDYDRTIDKTRFFEKGQLIREEIASMFNGKVDVRRYFENGVMVLKLVDGNHDSVFEEFQYFEGKNLVRIGWDRDGDGKPEIFEENPAFAE